MGQNEGNDHGWRTGERKRKQTWIDAPNLELITDKISSGIDS